MDADIARQVADHETRLRYMEGCVSEVGDAVLGKRQSTFAGGGRDEDGLIHKVDNLTDGLAQVQTRLANGITTRLAPGDRVRLYVAAIGFFGVIIAAAVGAFS